MRINWNAINNPEEKLFLKQVAEYRNRVNNQYYPIFTDFYPLPWMEEVIQKYIGMDAIAPYRFWGSYEHAERQMLGILPDGEGEVDFPITILKVTVKTGIGKALSHRDYLGALLGLGIEKVKVGDIIVKDFGAYLLLQQDIAEFVLWNLNSIGRYGQVELTIIPEEALEIEKPTIKEMQCTVVSLRADVVFAAAFHLSRGNIVKLFEADKAKCNGMSIATTKLLKVGDVCSLRGQGKIRLAEINGKTKKDRWHIGIEKYS